MIHRILPFAAALLAVVHLEAQTPEWIWSAAPPEAEESRVFRRTFTASTNVAQMILTVAVDNAGEVKLDGRVIAKNDQWQTPSRVTLMRRLPPGEHTLQVAARNDGGAAGLLLTLDLLKPDGTSDQRLVTDAAWQVSPAGANQWVAATSLGKLGVSPWGDLSLNPVATPASVLQVADGFKVELLHSAESGEGSWVSMTRDPQGRLIISPQGNEPMRRVTLDPNGQVAKLEPINVPVHGAMGMLYAFDALYANAQGPNGYHLYRITDTNGDDQYDHVELLRKWSGGAGEHGAHGIVKGPDDHLYMVDGNFVDQPTDLAPASRVRNYADDLVLPRLEDGNGFGANRKPPGGFVLRVDRNGQDAQVYAAGERNTYDIAFNPNGELFGFDSDMEWDWGTPWYRPTRVYHIVSGGDQGFREGSGKWPEYYSDSLPAVVNVGIGSPTGIKFGVGARFPERFQRALFVMDWSYGRILAVHLTAEGASYHGSVEPFVKGKPLNVTDFEIGPDGAMYFITGGRGTQSGLYRVSYVGPEATTPAASAALPSEVAQRRKLEALQARPDPSALPVLWEGLASPDRHVRFAARVALERLPAASWRDAALAATDSRPGLTALLALARVGAPEDQVPLLKALTRWPLDSLDDEAKLNKLRVIEVSFARHGIPEELRALALEKLGRQFPAKSWPLNRELVQLLVALQAPDVVAKALDLRDAAKTQEEQLHYQAVLRLAKPGWTRELRGRYFTWFRRPPSPGDATIRSGQHPPEFVQWFKDVGLEPANGASFDNFVKHIREEAFQNVPDAEKAAIARLLTSPAQTPAAAPLKARPFVKEWKTEDLQPALAATVRGRNYARGQEVFTAAQCAVCHRFNGEGGAVGPDLTGIGTRYARADVLKSITEPSAVISEQYQNTTFTLTNGDELSGRVIGETPVVLVVVTDPLTGLRHELKKAEIKSREAAKLSPMPEGLMNNFTQDEFLDLLAYLQADGKADAPAFKN